MGIWYGCKYEKCQMKKKKMFLLFLLETDIVGTRLKNASSKWFERVPTLYVL